MLSNAEEIFLKPMLVGIKPQKKMTVSQWADENRYLTSETSAEPGKFRTARTPYLKEPMDCLSDCSDIEEVIVMKGAQVGFTEGGNNWLGYIVDQTPAPTMLVLPTDDVAKDNSKIRIDPLFEMTPCLRGKVTGKKSRESGNTVSFKKFLGGYLTIVGANSPSKLRSKPIRRVMFDEVDAFPGDSGGEGDPVNLAKKRANTFSRKKFFLISTPLDESTSRIARAFENSDQRYYYVPCPDCGEKQKLKFENLKWEAGEYDTVLYYCEHCGVGIQEHKKSFMLAGGEWIPENPKTKNKKAAGFHLNSLYSPVGWLSWADIAKEWEEAKKSRELLKTFVNTVLGETWKDKGEAPEWRRLYDRREEYQINELPKEVIFLTAAVDVQKDRLECEIKGWGRNKESWSIDVRVFLGDTSSEDLPVWKSIEKVLSETWKKNNLDLGIQLMVVDSGYNTQTVYNFVRRFPPNRVRAIKGSDNLAIIFSTPKDVEVSYMGQKLKKGLKLWTVGVSMIKSQLYGWLKQDPPTKESEDQTNPIGYCHFPQYDEDFFKQLTAEEVQIKMVKGYRRHEWVKVRDRNEALDLSVYNRAAAAMIGIDRFTEIDWEFLEKQFAEPLKIGENETNIVKKPTKTRKKSNFW
jgi:phage terminase large subunit GpA-like protein